MWFPSKKSIVRVCVFALFTACLGLYLTTGQAAASASYSSWQTGCDNQCHHHSNCNSDRDDNDNNCNNDCNNNDCNNNCGYYGYNYDNNDGHNYNYYQCNYYNTDHGNYTDNCDGWDTVTGACIHWKLNISNPQSTFCDQWDSHTGYCTHWATNSSNDN